MRQSENILFGSYIKIWKTNLLSSNFFVFYKDRLIVRIVLICRLKCWVKSEPGVEGSSFSKLLYLLYNVIDKEYIFSVIILFSSLTQTLSTWSFIKSNVMFSVWKWYLPSIYRSVSQYLHQFHGQMGLYRVCVWSEVWTQGLVWLIGTNSMSQQWTGEDMTNILSAISN